MHARVSTFEGQIEDVEGMVAFARTTLLPQARGLAGWRGFLDLVDPANGKEILVTLWDSEEHLLASEERAAAIRSQGSEHSRVAPVAVGHYEVALGEVAFGS